MGGRCRDRRRRPSEKSRGIGFPSFSQGGKKPASVKCVYTFREVGGGSKGLTEVPSSLLSTSAKCVTKVGAFVFSCPASDIFTTL